MPDPHQLPAIRDAAPAVQADPARNPALAYVAHLAEGSRRAQASALGVLAALLRGIGWEAMPGPAERWRLAVATDWSRLEYAHVQALRALLAERYAPATANRHLVALRRVLRCAWRLGLMDAAAHDAALADLEPVRGTTQPAGRSLVPGELAALARACAEDPRPQGARDAAMLGVLYGAGLRRAEVVGLELADYTPATGALQVRGKGGKHRVAHVTNGAGEAMAAWLELRGLEPGPLFIGVTAAGRLDAERKPMGGQAVLAMLRRRAGQAGVAGFSPHDLRRTHAGDLLDEGVDLATVQAMMGHASPTTTARYDRRPEAARRRAAERLHFPYQRRAAAA